MSAEPLFPKHWRIWIIRVFVWLFILALALIAFPNVLGFEKGFLLVKQLPLGWMRFLIRTVPEVTSNWDLIGMAVLCLAGFFAGSHWFLRRV